MYKIKRPATSIWDRLWEMFLFAIVYTLVVGSALVVLIAMCMGAYKIIGLISTSIVQFVR